MHRECESCGETFEAKRSTARFCSSTCRSRARRSARSAEAAAVPVPPPADAPGGKEHDLVKAVRKELGEAEALETVAGQLALQVARRIAEPDGSGISALSKELRVLLAEATAEKAPTDGPAPEPAPEPEDEVDQARRRREEARQAAGLA